MDSKRGNFYLVPAILVATSLILSACQESGHKATARFANRGAGAEATGGDGAGRSKLSKEHENKVVNPTELAAYKELVKPLLEKASEGALAPWEQFFKLKKWIMAPMDIKKEESKSLSVTFKEDGTRALARQTQFEVWMDSRTFNEISKNEQADLVLTEFLTGLYTIKYLTSKQVCSILSEIAVKKDCPKNEGTPAKAKATPLSQSDYSNIRVVKNYILQQGKGLRYEDLLIKMEDAGFDMRLLSLETSVEQDEIQNMKTEISGDAAADLVTQVQALDKLELRCQLLKDANSNKCSVAVESEDGADAIKYSVFAENSQQALISQRLNVLPVYSFIPVSEGELHLKLVRMRESSEENEIGGAVFTESYTLVSEQQGKNQVEGMLTVPGLMVKATAEESGNLTVFACIKKVDGQEPDILFVGKDTKFVESLKTAIQAGRFFGNCE